MKMCFRGYYIKLYVILKVHCVVIKKVAKSKSDYLVIKDKCEYQVDGALED